MVPKGTITLTFLGTLFPAEHFGPIAPQSSPDPCDAPRCVAYRKGCGIM